MTVKFYLNKDVKAKGTEQIIFAYVRGFGKGKTIKLHTGEKLNPNHWNLDKQEVRKSYVGSPELNQTLFDYKEKIKRICRDTLHQNPNADFDDFKESLNKGFDTKKSKTAKTGFFEVYKEFLDTREKELSESMYKKYEVLRNHLKGFETSTKHKVTFNSMNLMFFDRFTSYLMNEKNHTNNTINKQFDNLKSFLNWSAKRKLNTNLDYLNFKTKDDETEIIYLTDNELNTLYDLDLKGKATLEKVRDVFCFSCFTGARFSDVSGMKRDDIKDRVWHLRVEKTRDILEIPLNDDPIEILNKYLDNKKPLPVISNQKTNEYLKELCKLAGIDEKITIVKYQGSKRIEKTLPKYELVSSHTARRTYVTLSLEKGMRVETVMSITGHKDYSTFKKYIKITSNVKTLEMNKAWNKEPKLKLVNL